MSSRARTLILIPAFGAVLFGVAMSAAGPRPVPGTPTSARSPLTQPVAATSNSPGSPNFTVSPAAESPSTEERSAELALLAPDADLWSPPPGASARAPGTLVQAQQVIPTPPGLGAVYRVLYWSDSVDGRPITVSGVVYLPAGRAPVDGWPVITWGRGTSGSADRCAPSRHIGEDTVPLDLARRGFLVTATDYQGLGTDGLQPYLVGDSEGRAMLDIVSAADSVPGARATRSFAAWGHSQGGHAALFARELSSDRLPDRPLVATVAMAPPSFIPQIVETWALNVRAKALGIMALAGLTAAYPEARLDDLITPQYLGAVREALETGCTDDINRRFADVPGDQLFAVHPAMSTPWGPLLHAQEPAQRAGTGPVVLVHGELDATLPQAMSAAIETQMCRRGEPVTRWLLQGQGHGEIIGAAWQDMVAWTSDRFAGRAPVAGSCP